MVPTPSVSTLQTSNLPVFPDAEPLVHVPAPPTLAKIETTETLLTMQHTAGTVLPLSNSVTIKKLNIQEPNVCTTVLPSELILDTLPTPITDHSNDDLPDAMDRLVQHKDVSFNELRHWLKFRDCMDVVTGRISDLVDMVSLEKLSKWDSIKTKPCRVELV